MDIEGPKAARALFGIHDIAGAMPPAPGATGTSHENDESRDVASRDDRL